MLQILLDDLCLPRQVGHVPVDQFDESAEGLNLLGELFGELLLLLVAQVRSSAAICPFNDFSRS